LIFILLYFKLNYINKKITLEIVHLCLTHIYPFFPALLCFYFYWFVFITVPELIIDFSLIGLNELFDDE